MATPLTCKRLVIYTPYLFIDISDLKIDSQNIPALMTVTFCIIYSKRTRVNL